MSGTHIIQANAFSLVARVLVNVSLRGGCGGTGGGAGVPGEASRGHRERENKGGERERGSRRGNLAVRALVGGDREVRESSERRR